MYRYLKILISKFYLVLARKFHKSHLSSNLSSIHIENFINYLRGVKVRFYYSSKDKFFLAIEGKNKLKFTNKIRGIELYRDGILKRVEFVFASYCLGKINFSKNDIVIDCGANFGDLKVKLSNFIKSENYIGIEPNPSDFEILKINTGNGTKLINKALGNINGNLPFYLSTDEGDSSIIEPLQYTEIINVPVIRLDKLIDELNIDKIKLLKIEAEGYEPEVLEGLGDKMRICQYIAVDGGYERGIKSEQTLTIITNHLLNNGFEMMDIYFPWCRALYVNKKQNF